MRSANFVEETTTSIAGTGGNGAITLTAIASVPRFSTVFGTQATTIRYVIEDTVNKSFETGIGSVAGNVLTRTRPQVTWNGATYDDSTPVPIAFGAAPASGAIRVRMSATAEGVRAPVQQTVSNNFQTEFALARCQGTGGNGSAKNLGSANAENYLHYPLEGAGLLLGIGFDVTTAAAGGLAKLALYSAGNNGLPDRKIVDFGTIDCSTTGNKSNTSTGTWTPAGPVWLSPGDYYIGIICNAVIQIRGNAGLTSTILGRKNGYGFTDRIAISGKSYDTGLPDVADMTGAATGDPGSGNAGLWVGLKVVA